MPTRDEIKDFSDVIEELRIKLRCNYMDAIVEHCEKTGLEIELAATLISHGLKAKIHEEAVENNMLKKFSKLPI